MLAELSGKTARVTRAASGIGQGLAATLADTSAVSTSNCI